MKMISRLNDAGLEQLIQQARQRVIDREADLQAAVLLHEYLLTRQANYSVIRLGLHEGDVCKLDGKEIRFDGVSTSSLDGVGVYLTARVGAGWGETLWHRLDVLEQLTLATTKEKGKPTAKKARRKA